VWELAVPFFGTRHEFGTHSSLATTALGLRVSLLLSPPLVNLDILAIYPCPFAVNNVKRFRFRFVQPPIFFPCYLFPICLFGVLISDGASGLVTFPFVRPRGLFIFRS